VSKKAIEFYVKEISNLKVKQPLLVLHFLKELNKFWTPTDVKSYAQVATNWNKANYTLWIEDRSTLKKLTKLNQQQQAVLETLDSFISVIEQIETMAN